MNAADISKTALITPFGLFEYTDQENVVADMLSRPPPVIAALSASSQSLDYAPSPGPSTCPSVEAAGSSSLRLKLVPFCGTRVLCDTSLEQPQPLIPFSLCRQVFTTFHSLPDDSKSSLGGHGC